MDVPSMVQRSGDTLIVRSVVSGDQIYLDQETGHIVKPPQNCNIFNEGYRNSIALEGNIDVNEDIDSRVESKDEGLPQCKIKRNYSCNSCTFFTQNPRYFLTHLRDLHGEKIVINECKLCLYASRHYQKLVRHMKMVHGSTEGIEEHAQARKRQFVREGRKRKTDESMQVSSLSQQQQQQKQQQLQQQQHHQEQLQQQQQQNHQLNLQHQQPVITANNIEEVNSEELPQNRLLKCSVCDFTTLYRAQLVDHEQDEHDKTKFFRCEKCSYVTHIKARFSKHVKYHSMPMIKCVTCDFRTPYKWNLDRHMKNHGGSGPFKCAACNFTADIKQSLTVHEMNHHVPPVGHAAGMSMARRKNKVGGTDIIADDFFSENGDVSDSNNNNNIIDDFDEPYEKKCKYDDEEQPTDLSQKSSQDGSNPPRKTVRPVPNLIPIQAAGNALNLTKHFSDNINVFTQKDPTSKGSLKDFFTLLLGEEKLLENITLDKVDASQLSPSSNSSSTSKKKSGNFFDKLKETLATSFAKNDNLICDCGHISKCLSESIIHKKSCQKYDNDDKHSSASPINLSVNSGSTRCQYCRHRCKSSADLIAHLRNCTEAGQFQHDSLDSISDDINERQDEGNEDVMDERIIDGAEKRHPMENRVFVWNRIPETQNENRSYMDQELMEDIDEEKETNNIPKNFQHSNDDLRKENGDNSYYGVETAPGYGEVTKKMTPEEEAANSSLKKVYKCPHCSFWASTASRFHVHIVGHLNKKPFECSLCAYRSNWRWDITKHIRLKTIRDPSHKNARVLMNDETGRRNYTKYNKFITLMKVTEEDGDPKLMKSGEMTPNQEASLSFLNDYNTLQKVKKDDNCNQIEKLNEAGSVVGQNIQPLDASRLLRLPIFANAIMGVQTHSQESNKRSPPPLIKPSDDMLLTQNIDMKVDGSEKRTLYKCRKCNYRNASRDMVLSHVKGHYHEAGINLAEKSNISSPLQVAVKSNIYMNNVLAAMCLSQQQLSMNEKITGHNNSIIPIKGSVTQSQFLNSNQKSPLTVNTAIIPLTIGTMAVAASNEHGETDEASSSGVVTTTGTGVTGWRGPAPYRCGHCHQVSNWKHVIQRHCRLKHNGDIRIETIDRNSDKNAPIYHPLATQPPYSGNNVLSNNTNNNTYLNNTTNNNEELITNHNGSTTGVTYSIVESVKEQNSISKDCNDMNHIKKTDIDHGIKSKQLQCSSCPFVSESKSQMTYHNSLHKYKQDLYQCEVCNYTCSKKQLYIHHKKAIHGDANADGEKGEAVDLRSKPKEENQIEKVISFCTYCPARYIDDRDLKLHLKMHTSQFPHHCKLCSYTARQEPCLLSHSAVHSTTYDNETKKLCLQFKQNAQYPKPLLVQGRVSDQNEMIWLVAKRSSQKMDVDDVNIEKSINRMNESEKHGRKSNNSIDGVLNVISSTSLLKQQLEGQNEKERNSDIIHVDDTKTEWCPHCPFKTSKKKYLNVHLQNHIIVSGQENAFNCKHCDFTVVDEKLLKDHIKLHFQSIENSKTVAFYTSYDRLELNLIDIENSKKLLYKSNKDVSETCSEESDTTNNNNNDGFIMRNKTIIDVSSGEVLNKNVTS